MMPFDRSENQPTVTVVISTRGRGDSVAAAIESVLANDYPQFTMLVVDQSEDAIDRFCSDSRFGYLRSAKKGLGAGHNTAISRATTELIAITDDDCVVPVHWLRDMVDAFMVDRRVALVFGNVYPGQYDTTLGYIPCFSRREAYLIRGVGDDLFRGMGIGACMGIRRSAWGAVHGFDTMLGPGAPLGSLEDRDMAIRLLLAGYRVYCTPGFNVVHNGFRANGELRRLAYQDWCGFGSVYAKHLKCGHWSLTRYMAGQMWVGQAIRRSLSHARSTGTIREVTPIGAFWLGALLGLTWPVDRGSFRFKTRPGMIYRLLACRHTLHTVTGHLARP
jgi:GT2 family glycosyltransferase